MPDHYNTYTVSDYVTITTYDTMPDAHIALGKLQSEGIPCLLQDENLVQTDWLYSIAIGGIKLRVPECYRQEAIAILERDDSGWLE